MTEKTINYLERAKKIHKNKYDYSCISDIYSNKVPLEIICPIHGSFFQTISSHIHQKAGCRKCSNNYKRTTNEWIEEAKIKHNNKYDYSLVEYEGNKQPVCIICNTHGEFWQTAKEHITMGCGCPACKKNFPLDTDRFIQKARLKHGDKFNYDLVDYNGNEVKIKIICENHGIFEQSPHGHLAGYGCAKCSNHFSKPENNWLDSLKIQGLIKQYTLKFEDRKYILDGFDPNTNTVYEFHGDYFHGNPLICDWYTINKRTKTVFGELYRKTKEKEEFLKSRGYSLVIMWESQWKAQQNLKIKEINKNQKFQNRLSFIKNWELSDDDWNFNDMREIMLNKIDCEQSIANSLKFC